MPMNAQPSALILETEALSASVIRPIPGSQKIHVTGSRDDLRVPMREVILADTPLLFGAEKNPPFTVYDTSGPYTDAAHKVDLIAGLPALRSRWIGERGDVETLPDLSSDYGRGAFSAYAHTVARQVRRECQPDALRAPRHYHAGNGIHRDPRKPAF